MHKCRICEHNDNLKFKIFSSLFSIIASSLAIKRRAPYYRKERYTFVGADSHGKDIICLLNRQTYQDSWLKLRLTRLNFVMRTFQLSNCSKTTKCIFQILADSRSINSIGSYSTMSATCMTGSPVRDTVLSVAQSDCHPNQFTTY